ncbi:MAG TPA: Rieske 2Fe-2S domain-containing protein [Dehalococcoidia bacterium]|nr:Rieske 2Fe-2S domain-containing protein [Dehalococcoidia bacterium]
MLSAQDNEILCRVGPGTPMGGVFREYWIPALRSDEVATPDSPPVRIKLLGEELIGFRTTSGKVGLIQNSCPHRGASLFFGRNEEDGLRCVYHGWKFDVTGACMDMPSEPAESNFKIKVHAKAYPTHERNGVIWTYMGPREVPPPLPDIEANILNTDPEKVRIMHRPCNWMQGIEGEMDTIHAAFLHWGFDEPGDPGSFSYYHFKNRKEARFTARDTDFGAAYGCYRPAEDDTYYWRIGMVFFPFFAMQANGPMGPEIKMNAYVPMDDDHTLQWEIFVSVGENGRMRQLRFPLNKGNEPVTTSMGSVFIPQGTGWYDRWNIDQNAANDYKIDREAQKSKASYTGIPGIRQQDMAVTESMGTIYDRTHEHLGTSDSMIIRARRRWIAAAKAYAERGELPPNVDNPEAYRQRSGEVILPRSADWWEGSKHLREQWSVPEAIATEVPASGGGA